MVFRKWDFSPIDKSNGGTEVPLPNNIEKFLANDTKGFEARKELFEKISDELYAIFYENKKVDFDIDLVFEEWINQLGFLGQSIKSLRTIFYVIENEDKFLSYHLKAVKGTLIVHSERWLNHFEELTPNEALILHKVLNT
ncbi:hypothetical protein NG782_08615 [Aliarcobacter cryaerophilus]|uniref:hypothetical protein n=1 Tax=Aliarcobacter cryaerophilus TaxID=28198 RepID=UPI003DA4F541